MVILFGPREDGPGEQVVLIEKSATLRSHAGQAAFPGGGREDEDSDLLDTALREAWEEIGLDASGVRILAPLPSLHLAVSNYDVTPVLAWWEHPSPVYVRDRDEVARVVLVAVAELLDPTNRFRVRHPRGYIGPAFETQDLLVWGFTAMLLDRLLHLAGLEQPWDPMVIRTLD